MTAIDDFFTHYYARRPVNATFTGVHAYDDELPDWSPDGLAATDAEMESLGAALAREYPSPASAAGFRSDPDLLDAELARAFLEIQRAENGTAHGPRGNPSLWTGEAIFSLVSLMIHELPPTPERLERSVPRLAKCPGRLTFDPGAAVPPAWKTRAVRDAQGGQILLTKGLISWMTWADLSIPERDRFYAAASGARAQL